VAEALYWAGRYIERAENTARFIDVNLQMGLDAPLAFSEQWEPLVAITGGRAAFYERYEEATRENVIHYLASDRENPSSIVSCLTQARENARSIRDVLSSEVWEQTNRFYLLVSRDHAADRAQHDSYQFFSEVKLLSQLIQGVADNTMSHGQAWHFLRLGRSIERADNTSRLLDVKYFLLLPTVEHVGSALDEMQWSVLLRASSAFEMYRKRHGRIAQESVIDFLLLDKEFPRAVLFCLLLAEESLQAITGSRPGTFRNPAEQRLGRLRSELAYAQVYDIIAAGLHEFVDGFQTRLNAVGSAIGDTFFTLQPLTPAAGKAGGRSGRDVLSGDQSQGRPGGDS
jgi:uncharacterized alpha-E superfamily protein